MNGHLEITIGKRDSAQLLEIVRDVARSLRQQKLCVGFTPINRDGERRIDCYLFDVTLSKSQLEDHFTSRVQRKVQFKEQSEVSTDWKLIKIAGDVTEILLAETANDDTRFNHLFWHHLHYIMNSLGNTYRSEAEKYRHYLCPFVMKHLS